MALRLCRSVICEQSQGWEFHLLEEALRGHSATWRVPLGEAGAKNERRVCWLEVESIDSTAIGSESMKRATSEGE